MSPIKNFVVHKLFLLSFFMTTMVFYCHAQSLSCTPVPDCIVRSELYGNDIPSGDMIPYGPVSISGWDISHGSPTVMKNEGIWMWSYTGDTRGEGVYTCYNFIKNHTYRICLEVKCDNLSGSLGYEKGYFFIQATNGNFNRPVPVSNQVIAKWRMTDQQYTRYTYTFTANRNYSKLWLFPYMADPSDGAGSQYASILRSVRVEEVKQAPKPILSSDTVKIINRPAVSGYWSWNHASNILSSNGDSSIIKVQVCEPTLFQGKFITDCNICDTLKVSIQKESDAPIISISGENTLCAGGRITLGATGADNYIWSPGNTTGNNYTISPVVNTTYIVTGIKGICSLSLSHNVFVNPVYNETRKISICQNESYLLPDSSKAVKTGIYTNAFKTKHGCDSIITTQITLNPVYLDTLSFIVDDGNSFQLSDDKIIDSSGIYSIIRKTMDGCDSTEIIKLTRNLFIPNLITPNSDASNDKFVIKGMPEHSHLKIYNRWGTLVYQNHSYNNSWDAEGISGIYYYDLLLPDERKYNGWLQVIK